MTRYGRVEMIAIKFKQLSKSFLKGLEMRFSYDLAIWIPIILYAAVFSHFTIFKHYTFNSYAWDLGVFNQALYTTVFNGRLLYYTADLYLNPEGCYLAIHFSPILFLLTPIYALFPTAETLLIIKSSALALGALPLYFLAKEKLGNEKAAFMLAVVYLLSPGLQGANWFDFQPQVFIPLLTFASLYFMEKERWKLFFISLILSLMISEHTTLMVLAISAYMLITSDLRRLLHPRRLKPTREIMLILAVAACLSSWLIAGYVKGSFPINPEFLEKYRASSAYRILGFKEVNLLALPIYILQNMDKAIAALSYDYPIKLLYVVLLLGPLAFIPLGDKSIAVTLLLLLPFIISNNAAYYKIGAHYSLYVLTPIFMAALETLSKKFKGSLMPTMRIMVAASLIFMVSVSPISPLSSQFINLKLLWYPGPPQMNENVRVLHEIMKMIPENASVLTQNHLFPHLSSRINAYVIPVTRYPPKETEILKDYVRWLINMSDYVLLDLRGQNYWSNFLFNEMIRRSNDSFGVYAFTKQIVLFRRGHKGPILMFPGKGEEIFVANRDFYIKSAYTVVDETSISKRVVFYPKGSEEKRFIYGPYTYLPPGTYNVTFLIKVNQHEEGYVGTLDVADEFGMKQIARRDLYGLEFESNSWSNITLTFTLNKLRTSIEFRVFSSGRADMYVDCILLRRISDESEAAFGTLTFNYKNLRVNGELRGDGVISYPAEDGEYSWSVWYGPYIDLPPGKYRVSFILRVDPQPEEGDKIIRLDIAKDHGENSVTSMELYGKMFSEAPKLGSGWRKITLEFNVESPAKEVEFRGIEPSEKYNIQLAYILLEKTS